MSEEQLLKFYEWYNTQKFILDTMWEKHGEAALRAYRKELNKDKSNEQQN